MKSQQEVESRHLGLAKPFDLNALKAPDLPLGFSTFCALGGGKALEALVQLMQDLGERIVTATPST
eukprot:2830808-Amphidinium_carterae.2